MPLVNQLVRAAFLLPVICYSSLAFGSGIFLEEVDILIKQGELLEAKDKCKSIIDSAASEDDRQQAKKTLQNINIKILFSPVVTSDSFIYHVKAGDSLSKIAKANKTTVDLIKKSNGLKNDVIYEGMKLKVIKTVFSISVDISDHELELYSGDELLKTYPVATGKLGHATPEGTFSIVNKLENPTWYHEGEAVPSGDPENILGTRWMGFSLKGYGIHGTTLSETVGSSASEGCIRMLNQDVEELFSIVPQGTNVNVAA